MRTGNQSGVATVHQITLSDHAGDQANKAASVRADRFKADKVRHTALMEKRQAKAIDLRKSSQRAFAEKRWIAGSFGLLVRLGHALTPKPAPPTITTPGRDENVWNAGKDGEVRVYEMLSAVLSDDWTLVSGYRNSGGEIDQLLVGPPGVLAVEIKFINGRVFCDGDDWWRDKYDKYGNLVETSVPISDRRGRGPSAQVNAAADRLQSFLNKRDAVRRIHRAVVLSHDASELGKVQNPTVDLVTKADHLSELRLRSTFGSNPPELDVSRIVGLIERDHAYHKRPRNERKNTGTGRRRASANYEGAER